MDEFTDKLILFAFGTMLLVKINGTPPVIAALTAVIAAALGFYIEEKKGLFLLFFLLFLTASYQSACLLFFPLPLYDMILRKTYAALFPFFILFAVHPTPVTAKTALWTITLALAVLLALKTGKKRALSSELIRIRDNVTELNIALTEKNKRLLEEQDHEIYLATLRERNRIAREIHDNVGHMLSRSLLMTGALLTLEPEGGVHSRLLDMKDTLNLAMDSIRQSVHNLHDDSIDLRQAIQETAKPLFQDFDVNLEYDMSDDIPKRVKYCFIATAKEAVSNILKHSGGNFVRMNFREHPGFFQLSVWDNGTNAKIRPQEGIGLQNMKDRASSLGGTFRIHTANGFSVFLTIPKTEELLCESSL